MVVTCTSMVRFQSIITPIFLALGDRPMTSSQIDIEDKDKDGQGRRRAYLRFITVKFTFSLWRRETHWGFQQGVSSTVSQGA